MTEFHLNKKDDETFELVVYTNMRDEPFFIERSDDFKYLYNKKWEIEENPENTDNFESYEVRVVKRNEHGT